MFKQNGVHSVGTRGDRVKRPVYLSVIAGLLLIIGCFYLVVFGPIELTLLAVHGVTVPLLADGLGVFAWIALIVSAIGIIRGWLFSRRLLICGLVMLWGFTMIPRPKFEVVVLNTVTYICVALPLFTRRSTSFFQNSRR